MSEPFDVVVCGSLHLDVMVKAPHLPRLDETAVGSDWELKCGGKGGNQAVMARRAGARTAMIGCVGKDDFGDRLLANLDAAGVDRTAVGVDASVRSGMSVAIVDAAGDYGAVIVSGSNLAIPPGEIGPLWARLGGGRVLMLQNEAPEAVNVAAARAARAAGARTILNAAPARTLSAEFLDLVDTLVVNRVEAEMMSGLPVASAADALAALPRLSAAGRDVVITLGGDGLVLQPAREAPTVIPPHKVAVVSTHGAGDSFLGSLACALARGSALEDACRIANRAAADYVSAPGS